MRQGSLLAMFVGGFVVAAIAGCGESKPEKMDASLVHSTSGNHGWWCPEHGVPEEVCPLCDTKLIAGFKERGDWCAKHDRPDTQCFACHPELEANFARLYYAKYGKNPPKPTDNGSEPEKKS